MSAMQAWFCIVEFASSIQRVWRGKECEANPTPADKSFFFLSLRPAVHVGYLVRAKITRKCAGPCLPTEKYIVDRAFVSCVPASP